MGIKAIEEAVNVIVKEAQPERVILFGSFSKDSANRDSDLDILVIKETDKRPIDRRIEIERLFPKRDRPLDIFVYTPKEINYLFSIGSPFINEILQTGRVVYTREEGLLPFGEPTMEDAKRAVEQAEKMVTLLRQGLKLAD